jgi:hypothetical protein
MTSHPQLGNLTPVIGALAAASRGRMGDPWVIDGPGTGWHPMAAGDTTALANLEKPA